MSLGVNLNHKVLVQVNTHLVYSVHDAVDNNAKYENPYGYEKK